jgi:transglutaminase-like putative cysteine protease
MRFRVHHLTAYAYDRPVRLGPHWLRLRPRSDAAAEVAHFSLAIEPEPAGRCEVLDADGNLATRVWFVGETSRFEIRSRFELRTARGDPYDFLPEPASWHAVYPPSLQRRLAPWTDCDGHAPEVQALAGELRHGARDAFEFVRALNERLHRDIRREIRETGAAQSPQETLRLGRGACRDLAVLFAAACRSQGLAARFVSGYQARGHSETLGGSARPASRYMHAWPEVYLPGAGWRGFDPTHGLAVAGAHVALAAAARPEDAAPVTGHYHGAARSRIHTEVHIDVDD